MLFNACAFDVLLYHLTHSKSNPQGEKTMSKATAPFAKGQIVFQACPTFSTIARGDHASRNDVLLGVVIARQVDACGTKKITFFNRDSKNQNDFVFGRSVRLPSNHIFNSAQDAFNFLNASWHCDVICPDVYSDSSDQAFADLKFGAMRVAAKS